MLKIHGRAAPCNGMEQAAQVWCNNMVHTPRMDLDDEWPVKEGEKQRRLDQRSPAVVDEAKSYSILASW